jgi:peptidoglycan hydrolase-like protein with peptidoglycan-binding domain
MGEFYDKLFPKTTVGEIPVGPLAPPQDVGTPATAARAWQNYLNQVGAGPVKVDNNFGPESSNATRVVQSRLGVSVDGSVGPQTWGAAGFPANYPILRVKAKPAPGPGPVPPPRPGPGPVPPKPGPGPIPPGPNPISPASVFSGPGIWIAGAVAAAALFAVAGNKKTQPTQVRR